MQCVRQHRNFGFGKVTDRLHIGNRWMLLGMQTYYANGAYHFNITDYQGNIRAVIREDGILEETSSYYPYGGLMGSGSMGVQPYKYGGKELDRENGLDLYDSHARMYDPITGRTTTIDPLAEKYTHLSPYLWCAANPLKYVDKTGKVIIFINGMHFGDGGSAEYWDVVDDIAMEETGDMNAIYIDGSYGGKSSLFKKGSNLMASNRIQAGFDCGYTSASKLIELVKQNKGKIKIITHSMGAAYGKGYAKGILQYAKDNDISIENLIEFEIDLAPFQPRQQTALKGVETLSVSHMYDIVAGTLEIDGAYNQVTRKDIIVNDKEFINVGLREHTIKTFKEDIKNAIIYIKNKEK